MNNSISLSAAHQQRRLCGAGGNRRRGTSSVCPETAARRRVLTALRRVVRVRTFYCVVGEVRGPRS